MVFICGICVDGFPHIIYTVEQDTKCRIELSVKVSYSYTHLVFHCFFEVPLTRRMPLVLICKGQGSNLLAS